MTAEKGKFDQGDIEIMENLFPQVKRYDTKAFSNDMYNYMPIPSLIMTEGKSAFVYDGTDINYLNIGGL